MAWMVAVRRSAVLNKSNLPAAGTPLAAGQFFGAAHGQLRTPQYVVTVVTHPGERVVPMHVHANPFFSMLVAGHYREWFGRGYWDARPLGLVLRPPQAEHRDEIGPGGAEFLCVDVATEHWDRMTQMGVRLERRAFENRPVSVSALRLLKEIRGREPGWAATAEALIAELIAEFTDQAPAASRREPRWLRVVLQRLHDDPENATLAAIAADLGLHPVYVTRAFRRHRGMTLSHYVKRLRLHHAARAILETREALADVAARGGYADQSHLTRALQRGTGWTPGRLRCVCGRLHREMTPRQVSSGTMPAGD